MTEDDDLNRLQAHLRATPPLPDPEARAAALAAALASFDRRAASAGAGDAEFSPKPQETAELPRPNPDRPKRSGWLSGVLDMLKTFSPAPALKGALAGSTALAAVALAVIALGPQLREGPPNGPMVVETTGRDEAAADRLAPRPGTGATAEPKAAPAPDPRPAAAPAEALAEAPTSEPVAEPRAEMAQVEAPAAGMAAPVPPPVMSPDMPSDMPEAAPSVAPLAAPPLAAPAPLARSRKATGFAAPTASGGFVPDMESAPAPLPETESFAHADANPVKAVDEAPVSTFSVDVDTASYAVVRQSLEAGQLPPKEAVRIEEMLNYFPYAYPQPEGGAPFRPDVTVFETPWNPGTQLVRIGLQGRSAEMAARPPLNLVFLVDTSGSMDDPRKLPLLQQALRLVLPQLSDADQVAIVAYAGSAGVVLPPTKATETAKITAALEGLTSGGGTAGEAGLSEAYALAAQMQATGEVSRVLLATDGDFNLGLSDPEALKEFVAEKRKSGTYLSVLGFGRGNLDDATMQALAQNGNGMAGYIDTLQEARKVLVDQLSGALFPLADDVKVQVEWNPAEVAEYRLIGYETRALAREDFNNDRVDAGEIGAGLQVTALYEVTPVGSAARLTDPLRYGAEPGGEKGELGFLRLRWKAPGAAESALIEAPIPVSLSEPDAEARFAAAIAGFGQLLTGAPYLRDWGWAEAIALAEGARGDDRFGYRIEAVNLMRLAASLPR
ncbi:MAG: VWA domain-containing protein [Gemmobacter sp.]|uniref:VWA domain-containing protein n=1 Tax=Gemmobacter sp. TaxID=1898957 RepID=UPI001A57EA92|nr:VWA domain-containing protein [Gemmobacter sp.]MBL8561231.1 VWA domain-containing protein [Gemmobacter sp.]